MGILLSYCNFRGFSNYKKVFLILGLSICAAAFIFFAVEISKMSKDNPSFGGYVAGIMIFFTPSFILLDFLYQVFYNTVINPGHCQYLLNKPSEESEESKSSTQSTTEKSSTK